MTVKSPKNEKKEKSPLNENERSDLRKANKGKFLMKSKNVRPQTGKMKNKQNF